MSHDGTTPHENAKDRPSDREEMADASTRPYEWSDANAVTRPHERVSGESAPAGSAYTKTRPSGADRARSRTWKRPSLIAGAVVLGLGLVGGSAAMASAGSADGMVPAAASPTASAGVTGSPADGQAVPTPDATAPTPGAAAPAEGTAPEGGTTQEDPGACGPGGGAEAGGPGAKGPRRDGAAPTPPADGSAPTPPADGSAPTPGADDSAPTPGADDSAPTPSAGS